MCRKVSRNGFFIVVFSQSPESMFTANLGPTTFQVFVKYRLLDNFCSVKDFRLGLYTFAFIAYTVSQKTPSLSRTHDPCGPLRPVTILHCCLLLASWTASGNVQLHQSVMSSDHLLGRMSQKTVKIISYNFA